jgi:uncharacterized protein (TIGR02246 family)
MTNPTAPAEPAIRALLDQLATAWNTADPDAYGDAFTDDARYIAFFGGIYRGRAEIASSHRALWGGALGGTQMFHEVVEVRLLSDDLAIAVTRGDVAKRRPKTLGKVQSYVVVRQAGRWRIAQFQNTKRSRLFQFLTYRIGRDAIPSLDR